MISRGNERKSANNDILSTYSQTWQKWLIIRDSVSRWYVACYVPQANEHCFGSVYYNWF